MTRTTETGPTGSYDPRQFPAFAVSVDIVILTMAAGTLRVLLVRRGEGPFEGTWAIPGGFKRPSEILGRSGNQEVTATVNRQGSRHCL